MIDLFPPERYDAIISNAGGCGSHLRRYGPLLSDDTAYRDRARSWDAKMRDVHEWLAQIGCRAPQGDVTHMTVAYHDSCHLVHGQKIALQPRALLSLIPGLTLVPLAESTWCCGAAGVYAITQPEQADLLLQRKLQHVAASGAGVVATANPGCQLQIARGLRAATQDVPVVHPVSLLAAAYRRERPGVSQGDTLRGGLT
jgi:glycolate oxidase iron-sulfur subunit